MENNIVLELLNLGVTGVLVVLLVTGQLVPKSTNDREIKRGDDATVGLVNLTSILTPMAKAMGDLATEIKGIGVMLTTLLNENKFLQTDISALKAEIAALKAEIARLKV